MRNIFLFGAGAAVEWGAPLTSKLTELIRQSGYKIIDSDTTITEFIYQRLHAKGFQNINFETIINVIEELIVFYSDFDSDRDIPSLQSVFFSPQDLDQMLNFSITGGTPKHGYLLEIPKGVIYPYSDYAYHNEKPEQFFFQHLINELLSGISVEVTEYASHAQNHSTIFQASNDEINDLFINWMKELSKKGPLRMYTLNYDRLFKVLLERSGASIFEGFDCGECVDYGKQLRANIPRILTDDQANVHYNLHGSAFWELAALDRNSLPNPELLLTTYPILPINFEQSSIQIEKGKTLLVTNMITGYQKSQKSILSPFKQMQAAFDKDCCLADTIYIIGYSFGDEHINASIKSAIRYNPKLKVILVDPCFIKNDMDYQFFIKLFPYREDTHANTNPKKVTENLYSYFNGDFFVHTITFKEFLQLKPNQKYPTHFFRLTTKAS